MFEMRWAGQESIADGDRKGAVYMFLMVNVAPFVVLKGTFHRETDPGIPLP
jgi:hypothetical protein